MCFALAGCGNPTNDDSNGGNNEKIDASKTQLYVMNKDGGYGNRWLYAAKAKYESPHASDSYENGKMGFQVLITDQKEQPTAVDVKNGRDMVWFQESMNYDSLMKEGAVADIMNYVTGENPYDSGKTIESKLYDSQKSFYQVNGSYYALPHYVAAFSINYNKKLFDDKGYYFIDGYESETGLDAKFAGKNDKKSAGPDGQYGTSDDGLLVTYDDFYDLCNYIYGGGDVPLVWMGKNDFNYLGALIAALASRYEGAVKDNINYTMDGTIDAVKFNDGLTDVLTNDDGTVQTEKVTVYPDKVNGSYNGYEIQRMVGKYYGMDFIPNIIVKAIVYLFFCLTYHAVIWVNFP